jgi:hypothetical protein
MTQPQTSKTIVVENVLASYLFVARPQPNKDPQTGKETSTYAVDGVFPATHPALAQIKAAQREVAQAAWGTRQEDFALGPANEHGQATMVSLPRFEGVLRELMRDNKIPLRDGNRRKKKEDPYTGNFYLAARNGRSQPTVAVTKMNPATGKLENYKLQPGDPDYPRSGDYVNLIVDIWAQSPDHKPDTRGYGQRINCLFAGIQLVKKGNPIGGGGRTANLAEFGLVSSDADSEPPAGDDNSLI